MLSIVNAGIVRPTTQSMNSNREELLFQLALTKPAEERAEYLDRERRSDVPCVNGLRRCSRPMMIRVHCLAADWKKKLAEFQRLRKRRTISPKLCNP